MTKRGDSVWLIVMVVHQRVSVIIKIHVAVTGIVMVSTPQDLVSMIVGKAVNMARKLDIGIIGLIENMSYIICPECSEKNKNIRIR